MKIRVMCILQWHMNRVHKVVVQTESAAGFRVPQRRGAQTMDRVASSHHPSYYGRYDVSGPFAEIPTEKREQSEWCMSSLRFMISCFHPFLGDEVKALLHKGTVLQIRGHILNHGVMRWS